MCMYLQINIFAICSIKIGSQFSTAQLHAFSLLNETITSFF